LAVASNRVEGFSNVARLTVLQGRGDGGFDEPNPRAAIGVEYVTLFLEAGFLNGDRIPDLISTGTGLRVLLGAGDGTFFALGEVDLGGIVTGGSVLVADVTGDGNGDVIAGGFFAGERVLVLLAGDGGGGFAAPVTFPVAGLTPQAIRAGDLNGDLLPDLVAAGTVQGDGGTTNLATLLAAAGGSFAVDQTFVLNGGSTVHDARVVDLDGDGRLDILTQQLNIGLTALMGNGDGTFQAPITTAGPRGNRLQVADLDGDGNVDAVTGGGSLTTTSVALGAGDGTFGPTVVLPGGVSPVGVALGDFDLDESLDVAVGHAADVSVLFGRGDGAFDPSLAALAPATSFYSPTYFTDVDGDAAADLLTFGTSSGSPDAVVALGAGDGGFGAPATYPAADRFTGFTSIGVADFNGANGPDLAVPSRNADFSSGNLVVLANAGDGSFPTAQTTDLGDFQPSWVQATDADGDLIPDLAMVGTSADAQSMGDAKRRIAVFTGDGAGNFAAGTPFFPEANAVSILFADLNGDAPTPLPDLVAVCGTTSICVNGIAVALRNPDLTFGDATIYAVGTTPLAVVAADLDDDGALDLAVANSGSDTVSVLIGVEDGTFFAAVNHAVGDQPSGIAVIDATGDGVPDIVTIDGGSFSVLAGDGSGGFAAAKRFMTGSATPGWRPVPFADLNGDGLSDLAGSRTGGVDVYLHR
ncbi:MAG: VCBS repeat-containing protein, partial [Myxococcales bacterium]|nr:VCBS repeat-containing protein [Myxococcales bacterium]